MVYIFPLSLATETRRTNSFVRSPAAGVINSIFLFPLLDYYYDYAAVISPSSFLSVVFVLVKACTGHSICISKILNGYISVHRPAIESCYVPKESLVSRDLAIFYDTFKKINSESA